MSVEHDASAGIILDNGAGLQWNLRREASGWCLGTIAVHGRPVEQENREGMIVVRERHSRTVRWLAATTAEQHDQRSASLTGRVQLDGAMLHVTVHLALAPAHLAATLRVQWTVDADAPGWEICLPYHAAYAHPWLCHLYPFAEDSKAVSIPRLTYVGAPAALLYRDDRSLAVLYGLDPASDYLNPHTWTADTGFHFMDQVTPPQFRVGGRALLAGQHYELPLQLVFSTAGDAVRAITELARSWIAWNTVSIEPLTVRTPEEALALFLDGRRETSMWQPGIGYRLEEGDPASNFVYIGEQALSAYFEYRIYELTGDPLWRQRCFEQMDFMLGAQNTDPDHVHYGAMDTAYDLGTHRFDSQDRGRNVGYKPDLNAHMARYMLLTWQRVREREGLDRQEWYQAAVRAGDWVLRQRNPDGGLPQCVDSVTGQKSASVVSGRALPALPTIYAITRDPRYCDFVLGLERHLRTTVEARWRFTGHHPDLPPDEIEEASIWGAIEYWLDTYAQTGEDERLARAVADAYLAFLWWCPKQLAWVDNPTQCASAEQQHFLQYSIYCYQNRKVQCLYRLYQYTADPFFHQLYERVLQGIFWTQVTEGDTKGATHERICDPWLARSDYDQPAGINSLGTLYMSEQSLDTMLQLVDMGHAPVASPRQ